jgi:pyridoxine kinase
MTGVSYRPDEVGVAVFRRGDEKISYYFHQRLERSRHGTGDIFASAFTGGVVKGRSLLDAARLAADFTVAGMKATDGDETHWYGAKFEKALPILVGELNR